MKPEIFSVNKEGAEHTPLFSLRAIYDDKKTYYDFQRSKLIPLAYTLRHPKILAPERNTMAYEWVNKKDADRIEEYIQDHPQETINISDPDEVKAFLLRVNPDITEEMEDEAGKSPTIH